MHLPPFQKRSICAKCGNDAEHDTRYREAVTHITLPAQIDLPQYLERSCEECGYSWAEACMDDHNTEPVEVEYRIREF